MDRDIGFYSRWYDSGRHITEAFASLNEMDYEYRQMLGQVIVLLTNKLKEANKSNQGLISLGADRAKGLLKAQQKRRAEDQDKLLFKALTNLYVLTDTQRSLLSQRIGVSVSCLDLYRTACLRAERGEDIREVVQLINVALERGLSGGRLFLTSLNVMDGPLEESLRSLEILYGENAPAFPKKPQLSVKNSDSLIVEVTAPPPEEKPKAQLVERDEGLRIHRRDLLE